MWLPRPHKLLWGAVTACPLIGTWIRTLQQFRKIMRLAEISRASKLMLPKLKTVHMGSGLVFMPYRHISDDIRERWCSSHQQRLGS
jgi:hypothetical protein